MDDNSIFDNFGEIWDRVTASDEVEEIELQEEKPRHEERLCLVKPSCTSCAVRFLPKF